MCLFAHAVISGVHPTASALGVETEIDADCYGRTRLQIVRASFRPTDISAVATKYFLHMFVVFTRL